MEYLRRFLWFFATRLMLLTLIVALLIVGFYMAMNSANIYVLLTDGLTERAEVIIDGAESTQLGDFFEQSYLQSDQQLIDAGNGLSVYENYKITSYNHSVSLNWMWSWPWSNAAQAEITETVFEIEGKPLASAADKVNSGELTSYPPHWQGGRYRVQLIKAEGRWRINQIMLLESIVEPDPTPAHPAPSRLQRPFPRRVKPLSFPSCDTCAALTVHKH